MDRQNLASSSTSTGGDSINPPPPEDAWYNTYLKQLPQWQSVYSNSQPVIPIEISRVNQFDAVRLDVEMSAMLKEQLVKIFSLMKPGMLFQYEPELDAFLEFLVWRFSIWVDKPTPGIALMNFKVLNRQQQTGKFNFTTQFPHYRKILYKPDFKGKRLGKNVVFDMDMSVGDFITLFYLLKLPVQVINLKAIIVTPTGWANAATIDVVYHLLHVMGRDDILVRLGDYFGLNQSDPKYPAAGGCKYNRAIPHGSSGYLDSDTLYGLARDLPRSPRRYTTENSVKFETLIIRN